MKKQKIILTIPVYNEERVLEKSVLTLCDYFKKNLDYYDWSILIANNASTDKTREIADGLSKRLPRVKALHLSFKGRGNALRAAWNSSNADAHGYCDVDLATDISSLKPLFDSVLKEKNNIAIGNRYLPQANSKRTLDRLIYSKVYIWMVKTFFRTNLTDFQCGFKAVDKRIIGELLPKVKDKEWFFDSELLLRGEHEGFKIKDIPVKWKENRDSKVKIIKTSYQYIRDLIFLRNSL